MRSEFLHNCGNLFKLVQQHVMNPSDAMSRERLDSNFGKCNAVKQYLAPMSVIMTVASVLSSLLWSQEFCMELLIYSAISTAIMPFVVFYVTKFLSRFVFRLFGITDETEERVQVVTLQLMLLFFTVNVLCRLVPDSNMLNCIYVYAFYMLWYMAGEYLGIADKDRIKFMLAELVICAVAYLLLPLLLKSITPKHP